MVQLEGNTDGDILLKMESEVMRIGVDCSPFMILKKSFGLIQCYVVSIQNSRIYFL
jgi:hypothetical protein